MLSETQLTKNQLLQGVFGAVRSRKVARNTVQYWLADGTECIKYHDTVVVSKAPNGVITLNSGGFRSVTTKARFWEYGKVPIDQKNGIWYMPDGSAYYDGIQIVIDPAQPGREFCRDGRYRIVSEVRQSDDKKVRDMKKRITAYTMLITKTNLPKPEAGDCWFCSMKGHKSGAPSTTPDKPLVDLVRGKDHLLSHLEEGYVVGSLIVNAMIEGGWRNDQIGFYYHGAAMGRDFELKTIRKAVTKYLQRRLLPDINVK